MFITTKYINCEYVFIHGIPKAILKMSPTENDADGCWVPL